MPKKGYKQTEEHKKNISIVQTGKIHSEEHRKNLSIANTGKVRTKKQRRKMSIAKLGHIVSEKTRKKMSIAKLGVKQKTKKIKFKRIPSPYPELKGDCLLCTSHCKNKAGGYPMVRRKRKDYVMSRYVYEKFCGEIPEGLFVLHRCDRPNCINPKHLFLGTLKDNTQDMIKKGRRRMFPEGTIQECNGHKRIKKDGKWVHYKNKISE